MHRVIKGRGRFVFDGEKLKYIKRVKVVFEVEAISGMGDKMNDPFSVGVKNKGQIPEGDYLLKLKPGVPMKDLVVVGVYLL